MGFVSGSAWQAPASWEFNRRVFESRRLKISAFLFVGATDLNSGDRGVHAAKLVDVIRELRFRLVRTGGVGTGVLLTAGSRPCSNARRSRPRALPTGNRCLRRNPGATAVGGGPPLTFFSREPGVSHRKSTSSK